jgi:TetR/AcrR family transcriptional repressor of mexJK operon
MKTCTRRAILEAAQTTFSERGYDGASMDSIAAEAQVTKLTIYRHFRNKEALFAAALQGLFEELPAPLSLIAGREGPLRARLLAIARDLLDFATGSLMRRLLRTLAPPHKSASGNEHDLSTARFWPYHQAVQHLLERERHSGALEITDADIASTHFLSLVIGGPMARLLLTGIAFEETADVDDHVIAAVDAFLRAYGSDSASDFMPEAQDEMVPLHPPPIVRRILVDSTCPG